jgi:hypothetical protein
LANFDSSLGSSRFLRVNTNRMKGSVTETLVKSLLEDAGYRIVPLGIQEVIRELAVLKQTHYKKLGLPEALRKLPDYFVADQDFQETWLLEVKYRKQWSSKTRESLERQIAEQVKLWQPLYLMVLLGKSTKPNIDSPVYSIGVAKLIWKDDEIACVGRQGAIKSWSEVNWEDFQSFQGVFKKVRDRWKDRTLMEVLRVLRSLEEENDERELN